MIVPLILRSFSVAFPEASGFTEFFRSPEQVIPLMRMGYTEGTIPFNSLGCGLFVRVANFCFVFVHFGGGVPQGDHLAFEFVKGKLRRSSPQRRSSFSRGYVGLFADAYVGGWGA